VAGTAVSTNPAADIIVGLCGVASAVIGYASATHAEVSRRRDKRAARHAARDGAPESGPPIAAMPPPTPDPAAVLLEAAGPGAARTLRATGTVDLTVTITQPTERQPRMPLPGQQRRKDRREARRVRWGDAYTEDELAAGDVELEHVPNAPEPDDADQVNDEELTDGDYAGEAT
jgi:hypothetical protein